jgi:hypothetical protein
MSTATNPRVRRDEAFDDYGRRGYLTIHEFLDPVLLAAARAESLAICRSERGEIEGVTPAGERDVRPDGEGGCIR